MDISQIGLFALAEKRLAWLEQRQQVLAGNIANADTPRWQPQDLRTFDASLARAGAMPATTQPGHLSGSGSSVARAVAPRPSGRAPDGNAVSVDEQLMKVADTETSQELATNVYTKYVGLFRLALGRGQ